MTRLSDLPDALECPTRRWVWFADLLDHPGWRVATDVPAIAALCDETARLSPRTAVDGASDVLTERWRLLVPTFAVARRFQRSVGEPEALALISDLAVDGVDHCSGQDVSGFQALLEYIATVKAVHGPAARQALIQASEWTPPEISRGVRFRHITQAQLSGLAGGSREFPLHRATPVQMEATAKVACKSTAPYPPRPKLKQCDEYPFKATAEGAGLPGPGTERTFNPMCSMTNNGNPAFPAGSGPVGFSVCMISAQQNGSAGSALTWLFQKFRIGEGEAFAIESIAGEAPTEGDLVLNK